MVDLPQAATGASFYGTIEDAWFFPLVDIGFEGKGGKYLVLPPDYTGDVPAGYIPVRPTTYSRTNNIVIHLQAGIKAPKSAFAKQAAF